jgi:Ca2+-binding RTX toxin-like protein
MARLHWLDYGLNHGFTDVASGTTVTETVNGALVSVGVNVTGEDLSTGSFVQVREFGQYADSQGNVDFDPLSTLKIYSGGIDEDGNPADGFKAGEVVIDFDPATTSDPTLLANPVVQNLYFRLNDVDGNDSEWIDQVSIIAYDEFGQEIPVTITFEPGTELSLGLGNTIEGTVDNYQTHNTQSSAFVEIAGPVSSIEISYYNDEERDLGEPIHFVAMTDLHFEFAESHGPEVDHFRFPSEPIDAFPLDDLDSVTGDDTANLILTGDDADTIDGAGGDDTLNGGIDDDRILGGDGDDILIGDRGNDTIHGDDGDDTIVSSADPSLHDYSDYGDAPGAGTAYDDPKFDPSGIEGWFTDPNPDDDRDSVLGGAGSDVIFTGDDADTIFGGGGEDFIDGGIDDDSIDGGDGDDLIIGDHGSDTIFGRDGSDFIDSSVSSLLYPDEPDATDPFPDNDRDVVDGGTGDDTIFGGDDDDSLHGGTGFDIIDGGIDEDTISGGREQDSLYGGEGDDLIFGFNHDDSLNGGEGSATLPLSGDHDYLEGNEGDDTLYGGSGSDSLLGGEGADVMFGGEDDDWFHNVTAGDVIDGNETGNDHDTLSFRPLGEIGPQLAIRSTIRFDDPDNPGGTIELNFDPSNFENGTATYRDASDVVTGTLTFTNIENIIIPCFTPGTRIATIRGEVLVEDLEIGDRIITRDNGIQDIRWIGTRSLSRAEMLGQQNLLPIRIRQGALGNGLPERDMMVSPNHRMLVASEKAAFFFEEREVLVAAKHLVGMPGVEVADVADVTYIHFMFDHHEVVLSDGAWSESFQPGDQTIGGLDQDQRDELLTLFPELAQADGVDGYAAARRSLKKYEAQLLVG